MIGIYPIMLLPIGNNVKVIETPLAIVIKLDLVHESNAGEFMKNFSERLDARMKEMGISAAELSRKTGVSKGVISRMLNEPGREIRASSLMSVGKALKIDPVWLFLGRSADSLIRDIEAGPGLVPVWHINDLHENPVCDAWPHTDTGRSLATERDGHIFALEVDDDQLKEAGIITGVICLVDMGDRIPEHNSIMLVQLCSNEQYRLLRAIKGVDCWRYGVDDPRAGSLTEKDVILLGKVIEVRR
ncbi:helix-turn-helix domain-containing protein [Aeromonas enteropelogenes]|uniref:helix-turn-helix domain-containing protein n=1 Tax=Aeromonas enteropelogenes TaxID=29489 RepID=UPI003BA2FF43